MTCTPTNRSTVQHLFNNSYAILNPSRKIAVLCDGTPVQILNKTTSGRILVDLPCTCAVNDVGSAEILINENQMCDKHHDTTVYIHTNWTSLNVSPLHLFVPEVDVPLLANFTIPQIDIMTVRPPTDTGKYEDFGHFGNTWYETLLSSLALAGFGVALWWLWPMVMPCCSTACGLCCQCIRCCKATRPEYGPRGPAAPADETQHG